MPWVRLHGVKDYLDMVAILDEFPDIKQTFNLVPSLLEQIEEYTSGKATDRSFELSRIPAAELTQSEKNEILNSFFSAHYPTMIQPYRRYRRLKEITSKGFKALSIQDFLDLQVWFNLSWIDPIFRNETPISDLFKKGEGFKEEEKLSLLGKHIEILKRIIPKYRQVQDRGQIEISVTPFYHPILPLLCDTDIAKKSNPGIILPTNRFSHPEDAAYQINSAIEYYAHHFDRKPRGMWPSEGSVSPDIIPIIAEAGIEWIATDEEILASSLGKPTDRNNRQNVSTSGDLYQPYIIELEDYKLAMIFRDHALSDRLGFVYANWDPKQAAQDFVNKLIGIRQHLKNIKSPGRLVPVILDGENAWEYYADDGHEFFHHLYSLLSDHPELQTTTVSDYLRECESRTKLVRLFPGSWINHNFNIWIGHEEDNLAWDLLHKARKMLVEFQNSEEGQAIDPEKLKIAWKEIYIAEGSDWCWWFGDEHQGQNNEHFDSLFRSNLMYIYELLGKDIPAELLKPVRSNFLSSNLTQPTDFFTPIIDGKNSSFYEWYSAGYYDCIKAGSTMHRAIHHTKGIHFGFDETNIYIRIDPDPTTDRSIFLETDFLIEFLGPSRLLININRAKNISKIEGSSKGQREIIAVIESFLEMQIPINLFPDKDIFQFDFRLMVSHNGEHLETWPPAEVISMKLPKAKAESIFW